MFQLEHSRRRPPHESLASCAPPQDAGMNIKIEEMQASPIKYAISYHFLPFGGESEEAFAMNHWAR